MLSCPGKLFILGEYGVLGDGFAVSMAVNRRAYLKLELSNDQYVSELKKFDRTIHDIFKNIKPNSEYDKKYHVDTSEFIYNVSEEKFVAKLGLGSSAATALLLTANTILNQKKASREEILEVAVDVHRRMFGEGSGVDIATCCYGGILASKKQPASIIPLTQHWCRLEETGLEMHVFYSKKGANTSNLIQSAKEAKEYRDFQKTMSLLSEQGIDAIKSLNVDNFLHSIEMSMTCMSRFSNDSGCGIITEEMTKIHTLLSSKGIFTKASGAGGGDCMLAFAKTSAVFNEDLYQQIEELGFIKVDLCLERVGLTADSKDINAFLEPC